MKLGRKIGKEGPYPANPGGASKDRTIYPRFDLQDQHVDEYLKDHQPQLGDEVHAHVKLKVNHLSQSEHGKRIGFDVTEMHDVPGKKSAAAPSKGAVTDLLKKGMMTGGDEGSGSGY